MAATDVWGKVKGGTVWHLLTPTYLFTAEGPRGWCGTEKEISEETDGKPPRYARPCPKCCDAVLQLQHRVQAVAGAFYITNPDDAPAETVEPETYRGRLIEDVDLLGAIPVTADDDPADEDGDR